MNPTSEHCELFCPAWFWACLLIPLATLVPILVLQWHGIERTVAANAQEQLRDSGHSWATVQTFNRGRNVLLTGVPPDFESLAQARKIAANSYGVHSVSVSSDTVPPKQAARLTAIVTGDSVVLRGILPSEDSVNATLANAKAVFGEDNVINRLSIDQNTTPLNDIADMFDALNLDPQESATFTATIVGDRLSLSGDISDSDAKRTLESTLAAAFTGTISSQLNPLLPSAPVEEEIKCEERVGALLQAGRINFASGQAKIEGSSLALLDEIVEAAGDCPTARFEVAGHTDSIGDPDRNKALSQRRAEAVVAYLIAAGLSQSQFNPVGYGADAPLDVNTSAEGRARNRRIEFKLSRASYENQ